MRTDILDMTLNSFFFYKAILWLGLGYHNMHPRVIINKRKVGTNWMNTVKADSAKGLENSFFSGFSLLPRLLLLAKCFSDRT